MEATTKAPLIYKKMADIMEEIDAIAKARLNQQQNYKFRGIDDVYNAVHPLFKKHRIFMVSEILERSREDRQTAKGGTLIYTILLIRWKFIAEDGSFVESTAQGEGMDSGDKGSNKAMSTSQKYSIIQTFAIPLEDGNPDNDVAAPLDRSKLDAMLDEIKKFTDVEHLVKWANQQTEWHKTPEFISAVQKHQKDLQSKK